MSVADNLAMVKARLAPIMTNLSIVSGAATLKTTLTAVTSTKAGLPTTSDIAAGYWGVWKDTSGGGVYLAANDAGTIKKVQLL